MKIIQVSLTDIFIYLKRIISSPVLGPATSKTTWMDKRSIPGIKKITNSNSQRSLNSSDSINRDKSKGVIIPKIE
jgi:hypothetical protein